MKIRSFIKSYDGLALNCCENAIMDCDQVGSAAGNFPVNPSFQ